MNNLLRCFRGHDTQGDHGIALVMALVILLVMSIIIMGYSTDVELDVYISRNLELKNQALYWAESGIDIVEELVGYSVDTRGGDPTTFAVDDYYQGIVINGPLLYMMQNMKDSSEEPNVKMYETTASGTSNEVSGVKVRFQGTRAAEGGSIIIAAGYEGIGKGVAGAGGFSSYYQLLGRGYERHNSRQVIGTMYRHVQR